MLAFLGFLITTVVVFEIISSSLPGKKHTKFSVKRDVSMVFEGLNLVITIDDRNLILSIKDKAGKEIKLNNEDFALVEGYIWKHQKPYFY